MQGVCADGTNEVEETGATALYNFIFPVTQQTVAFYFFNPHLIQGY